MAAPSSSSPPVPRLHTSGRAPPLNVTRYEKRDRRLPKRQPSKLRFVPQAPDEDKWMELPDVFSRDSSPRKLDLFTESYSRRNFAPSLFQSVEQAERRIFETSLSKEYLLFGGLPEFIEATAELLLGADHPAIQENRVATIQTFGGSDGFRLTAEFIRRIFPERSVYLPEPSPDYRTAIFGDAGVRWEKYTYYSQNSKQLDFQAMMEDLSSAPDGSIVVLHGCAHHPTGVDPSTPQWAKIADLCLEKELFPLFDVTHLGLASGCLEADASVVRQFVAKGLDLMAIQSYSRSLGLYSQSVGALNFVASQSHIAQRARSHLARLLSGLYAFPCARGARLVTEIIHDPDLMFTWRNDLKTVCTTVDGIRDRLYGALTECDSQRDWAFLLDQRGLYSYLSLTPTQVSRLRHKYHMYLRRNGVVALTGFPVDRAEDVAHAVVETLQELPSE